jgi:hypothetical protein
MYTPGPHCNKLIEQYSSTPNTQVRLYIEDIPYMDIKNFLYNSYNSTTLSFINNLKIRIPPFIYQDKTIKVLLGKEYEWMDEVTFYALKDNTLMVYNNHIFIRDKCIPNISVYKIPSSNTMI